MGFDSLQMFLLHISLASPLKGTPGTPKRLGHLRLTALGWTITKAGTSQILWNQGGERRYSAGNGHPIPALGKFIKSSEKLTFPEKYVSSHVDK